ncbi:hypothetical protein L3Q72_01040 [Vibrio sp. JC009]|uniref:J domain-containing protein n=1 Tax=Vibrio sp. JC009 TaxID=2912314 RepID=UPI0023B06340|nr:hypothetical protein [Vibrio sp. JC009]WED22033.1 hypothetical protein L3Q72_01040 [Vibrio sp. JC009]
MNTLTITDITNTTKKGKEWTKLQKLWKDVEKNQARNDRYEKKLDDFLAQFKQKAEKSEQDVCAATEKFIRHLLKFIPRKTIKGYQREALYAWIEEELTILESNPFRHISTTELREEFTQALIEAAPKDNSQLEFDPYELDNFREELSEIFGEDLMLSDEELTEMVKDPLKFKNFVEEYMEQKANAFDEEDEDEGIDWEGFEDDAFDSDPFGHSSSSHHSSFHGSQMSSEKSLAFFQTKEITKLYRQLARQLHPDKESDPEKKEHKKTLMQQLSLAKKDQDTFAMLILAQTHLPDFELTFDKHSLTGLEHALKDKITQLNQAHQELQYGPELKTMIWQRFGGGNKQAREKSISDYVQSLNYELEQMEGKITGLKTVKAMQVALRERMNQNDMYDIFGQLFMEELQ